MPRVTRVPGYRTNHIWEAKRGIPDLKEYIAGEKRVAEGRCAALTRSRADAAARRRPTRGHNPGEPSSRQADLPRPNFRVCWVARRVRL